MKQCVRYVLVWLCALCAGYVPSIVGAQVRVVYEQGAPVVVRGRGYQAPAYYVPREEMYYQSGRTSVSRVTEPVPVYRISPWDRASYAKPYHRDRYERRAYHQGKMRSGGGRQHRQNRGQWGAEAQEREAFPDAFDNNDQWRFLPSTQGWR